MQDGLVSVVSGSPPTLHLSFHHQTAWFFSPTFVYINAKGKDNFSQSRSYILPPLKPNKVDHVVKTLDSYFLQYSVFCNFLHNLLEIRFNPKKNTRAAVFTPPTISLCLLSYPHTNYCFLSVRQKGWGCIFKQPDAINNSHTPSTDNMCVSLCQNLPSQISQVRLLCASDTYLQIISIRPKRQRDL